MKTIFFSAIITAALVITSCNNNSSKTGHEGHDATKDTTRHVSTDDNKPVSEVAVTFTNVDAKAVAVIKEVVDHYLHIKNALANDNAGEAASGAKAMEEVLTKLDKSLLTVEQKKLFDDNAEDLKEHAEHIGKNGDNIKHQRSHFTMMSSDVYELVKSFGAGKPIYHDHCPMYDEGKGAMWLSETKEIKNPYYGNEMLTCGTVEEVIK